MSPLEQWLQEQTRQGRHLYLVLDSDGQLDERNGLVSELGVDRYRKARRGRTSSTVCLFGISGTPKRFASSGL